MRVLYVGLSVRDARRSARWYRELFGMETVRESFTSSNWESDWDEVLLKHPVSGLLIGLLQLVGTAHRAGHRPLRDQGSPDHLPRSRQHPAGVLLAEAHLLGRSAA
jgi:catechol 2,3-dioxygenase-like lactoylglutathione lyase family enzyme